MEPHSHEKNTPLLGTPTLPSKKRWGILAIVCTLYILDVFGLAFFGFVNDVTATYYRVSPAQIDMISTLNLMSRIFICFYFVLTAEFLSFKGIALIMPGTIIIGNLLIVAGVSSRNNFAIVAMGQIVNGPGATICLTLSQMASSVWFPISERGISVSIPRIFRRLSPVISNLVATHSLNLTSVYNLTDSVSAIEELMLDFRISFQVTFAIVVLIALLGFLASLFYIPKNPTYQQDVGTGEDKQWILKVELRNTWKVLSKRRVVILMINMTCMMSTRSMLEWMLSSIVLKAFPQMTDASVGIMFCVGYGVGAFGSPAAGIILDRYKNVKVVFVVGCLSIITCCFGWFISMFFMNYPLMFISYVTLVFFQAFSVVCILHSLVDLMNTESSGSKIRAYAFANSLPAFSQVLYTTMCRATIENANAAYAALLPTPFIAFAAFFHACFY